MSMYYGLQKAYYVLNIIYLVLQIIVSDTSYMRYFKNVRRRILLLLAYLLFIEHEL